MRIVRFIIIFFISIFLLILALVNRQYVDFRFLPINLSDQLGVSGSITLPLFILTFIGNISRRTSRFFLGILTRT